MQSGGMQDPTERSSAHQMAHLLLHDGALLTLVKLDGDGGIPFFGARNAPKYHSPSTFARQRGGSACISGLRGADQPGTWCRSEERGGLAGRAGHNHKPAKSP